MTMFLHAPNVHQGGGLTLLNELLHAKGHSFFCILDSRMPVSLGNTQHQLKQIQPTLLARLKAEFWLQKKVQVSDTVLCFGNLPPLFRSKGKVTVFLQNRYLFGLHNFSGFSRAARLRLSFERWWFRSRMRTDYQIIVQSQTMQRELKNVLGFNAIVLPFLPSKTAVTLPSNTNAIEPQFDFVYVSSAEPHKNHFALLDAWVLLAEQGLRPSLALTVSEISSIGVAQRIAVKKQLHDLKITNFGTLPHGEVSQLYQQSSALIFPSRLESFGLPLLEAKQLGMPILAPELDYVRDVVEPDQTFDPDSPISIARAVMRHLKIQTPIVTPVSASVFLAQIQKQGGA